MRVIYANLNQKKILNIDPPPPNKDSQPREPLQGLFLALPPILKAGTLGRFFQARFYHFLKQAKSILTRQFFSK